MKRLSVFLAVLLLVSVAFTANAQNKVLLQYSPDAGTTTKYKMNIKGNTIVTAYGKNQQTNLETAMTIQQKVTGKDKDGNIDMETVILEGKITVNGTPTTLPNVGELITVKMAKDGTILSQSGMDQGGMSNNQMQIKFPTNPVGVGDTWTTKIEPNPQLPIPMETIYTVEGFEKVGGEDCVRLKSEVSTAKNNTGSINLDVKANGKIWFAYKKGVMMQNEVVSNMLMVMEQDLGNGQKEKITTRMKLSLKMGITK
jgi:hypothetical protein